MIESIIIAGDTLDFEVAVRDEFAPSRGWTLIYRMQPLKNGVVDPTGEPIRFEATVVNDKFRAQVGPDATLQWKPGDYKWSAWVEKPGARYTVDEGYNQIRPDPATSMEGTDPRSHARRVLAQIETALEAWAAGGVQSYTIAGRSMTYAQRGEVLTMRNQYMKEVYYENMKAALDQGAPNPLYVKPRFIRR